MPRPKSLTSEEIATAALAVIDRGGLEALSIRAVAAELGMGTMSLYRYFSDREQLEGFVVDLVFASVTTELPARMKWTKRVVVLLQGLREAVAAHPAVVPLLLTHRFTAESSMPWAEELMRALKQAGFDGKHRFLAFRLLTSYVIGVVQSEHLGLLPRGEQPIEAERHQQEYPLLAQNAPYARKALADEEFRWGLDVILCGLGGLAAG
jgi:AcrR family transcriptional regulator